MQTIQEILGRIAAQKAERVKIKELLDSVLAQSTAYVAASEEAKTVRAKVIQIQGSILAGCPQEVEQLERLKMSITSDAQLLTDLALSMLMRGESVSIEKDGVKFEPQFKVSFKQGTLF